MIGYLRGNLLERTIIGDRAEALVDVGGVGYRVLVPLGSFGRLGGPDQPVTLWVHTNVRDDAIELYGFVSRDERACFEVLIGAHGVGPSLAQKILSALTPAQLRAAVAADDLAALTAVKGVGKKTAAQVLLDLKSKLDAAGDGDLSGVIGAVAAGAAPAQGDARDARADVRSALAELGFGADEVKRVLADLAADVTAGAGSAELLRAALARLGRP